MTDIQPNLIAETHDAARKLVDLTEHFDAEGGVDLRGAAQAAKQINTFMRAVRDAGVTMPPSQLEALEFLAQNNGEGEIGRAPLRKVTVRALQRRGLVKTGRTRTVKEAIRYNWGRDEDTRTRYVTPVELTDAGRDALKTLLVTV